MGGRTGRVEIRVTERERAALVARSRQSGMTVSAYVRAMATRPHDTPVVEIDAAGLRKAYADLKHAGSNVNQIARALNTRGPGATPVKGIEAALADIARAADTLSFALSISQGR